MNNKLSLKVFKTRSNIPCNIEKNNVNLISPANQRFSKKIF